MSLETLSSYLADAASRPAPADVRRRAARVLADTLGAITAGMQEPEMARLRLTAPADAGPATVIGGGFKTEAGMAAFLNGAAGVFLELDEGASKSRGHPSIHIVPALLARAEETGGDGARLLDALALGYEVAVRVGGAVDLRPAMHPHGTWGVLAGAAALAVWDRAEADEIAETLRVAASLALATSRPTMLEGATVRNAYSGFAGQHAIQARRMVEAGFTGDRDALATVFGTVIGERWRPERLSIGLGDDWAIREGYFKRHACCRFNHAALDALEAVRVQAPEALTPEAVSRIDVHTYALAAELDDPAPQNQLAAKFSVPFALATAIRHDGDTWLDAFRGKALADPMTRALAANIRLHIDPDFEAQAPEKRAARVTVALKDGRELAATCLHAGGDPEAPFEDAVLDDKFLKLTTPIFGAARAEAALAATLGVEDCDDIRRLTAAFSPESA